MTPVTITYLQMLSKPENCVVKPPKNDIRVEQVKDPPVPFYLDMYGAIGEKWNWSERKKLTDEQVRGIIRHPDVYIYVLRWKGRIVGFAELDSRNTSDIELKYFGLVPDCIGKGFGTYFLNWTIQAAWNMDPDRFWLHTCTNDHPRALDTYIKAGFNVYKEETKAEKSVSDTNS